jgi:hypothetical protein
MSATISFKRLILRAVLRDVSPMVARLISVNDDAELSDLHDVFQQVSRIFLSDPWEGVQQLSGSHPIQATARVSPASPREFLHLRLARHFLTQRAMPLAI